MQQRLVVWSLSIQCTVSDAVEGFATASATDNTKAIS